MKITTLIKIFEKLLPIYKKAYKDDLDLFGLCCIGLNCGLCKASRIYTSTELYDLFCAPHNYYENFVNGTLLFPYPTSSKDLKPRIDFLESEITSLKRLLKKGYTHI